MRFTGNARAGTVVNLGKYPPTLRFLHWLIAILLIVQFSDAWTMPHIGRGTIPVGLIAWHLFFGTSILALMLMRLFWRSRSTVPSPPPSLPRPLQQVSRVTHYLMYIGVLLVALLGWANASARGWSVKLSGIIPLPAILPNGSVLGHKLGDVHATLATVLAYLIGCHIAAALYHVLFLRDQIFRRMV